MERPDKRNTDQLRDIHFHRNIAPHATGSVLASFGNTRVICSVMIEQGVPRWMKQQNVPGGWVTAEYAMLPYSTVGRKARDISRGKLDGRSSEIQRLIGRSLRAVIDLKKLGQNTMWIDCDVLQADGGTRTTSITGACVAASMAFYRMMHEGKLKENPLKEKIGAISCGIYEGEPILDLCYIEDRDASVDYNVVMTESGQFVEVQGSGEEATYSRQDMDAMLSLAEKGLGEISQKQEACIEGFIQDLKEESLREPSGEDLSDLLNTFQEAKS